MLRRVSGELRASVWLSAAECHLLSLAVAALGAAYASGIRAGLDEPDAVVEAARALRARLDAMGRELVARELGELPASAGLVRELLAIEEPGGSGDGEA